MPRSISVVVPAYNEESAVTAVVRDLRAALSKTEHEILVVDDGSTDKTAEAAKAAGATVLRHPVNRGYGRSLITGFNAARHDWVLMIDADGSYPPAEAAKLLAASEDFDMVIGARQGKLFWGPPVQSLLRWIYLSLARFVAGEAIPDANSGLRLIRKSELLRSIPFLCLGYSFSTTMTLSFIQSGRFVAYVPIDFVERTGRSKVRPIRDILRTLQIMNQIMIYYNPVKLAVTLAGAVFLGGAMLAGALGASGLPGPATGALVSCSGLALLTFLIGCLLDAFRMHWQDKDSLLERR
ncbi:MAG TPA: glycosyltransferase family 2 protein [Elusimicrobiota bacterium]|nr:glycosyltransferase family 2 protein [Elusimicrobiota bacterium]